jgi:hypothetical protein
VSDPIHDMYAAPKVQGHGSAEAPLAAGKDVAGWVLVAVPPICGILSGALAGTGIETVISLAMVVVCAFVAGADARRWGFRSNALGIALFFIVFYPVHFHRRGKMGAPLGLLAGLAAVILWFGLMVAVLLVRNGGIV